MVRLQLSQRILRRRPAILVPWRASDLCCLKSLFTTNDPLISVSTDICAFFAFSPKICKTNRSQAQTRGATSKICLHQQHLIPKPCRGFTILTLASVFFFSYFFPKALVSCLGHAPYLFMHTRSHILTVMHVFGFFVCASSFLMVCFFSDRGQFYVFVPACSPKFEHSKPLPSEDTRSHELVLVTSASFCCETIAWLHYSDLGFGHFLFYMKHFNNQIRCALD